MIILLSIVSYYSSFIYFNINITQVNVPTINIVSKLILGLAISSIICIINGNVAAYKVKEYKAIYLTTILKNTVKSAATIDTIKEFNNKLKSIIEKYATV